MLTLTQTAALTKKAFVFGIIFFFLLVFAWIGFQYYLNSQKKPPVQAEEKPDTIFNILDYPDLPESLTPSSDFTYELITTTGQLPKDLPKIMKVYFINKLGTTLLAPDRAKRLASNLGFSENPEILSPVEYRFKDLNNGHLDINLDTGNFSFEKNLATDSADLEQDEIFADQAKIIEEFKDYLASKNLLPEQLKGGRSKVEYNNESQKDSNQTVISLWQDAILDGEKKYPIITKDYLTGLINATVTKYRQEDNKYSKLDYIYWSIDDTNFGTYPIRSVEDAYSQLQAGKAIVVRPTDSVKVELNSIYLAYFLSDKYSTYTQPVYVFEGDNFAAVVLAITDEFLKKPDEIQSE